MSFDDGLMLGLMLGEGASGGGEGDDVYIVNGSETSITVYIISGRNSEKPTVSSETFSFVIKRFYKTTTIKSNSKEIAKQWEKKIITSISDSSGDTIFKMIVDDDGKITACYDRSGNEILHGETSGDSVTTSVSEGIALGWALAYSKEQNEETERAIDAYKSGREDEQEASGEEHEDTTFEELDLKGGTLYAKIEDKYYYYTIYYGKNGYVYHNEWDEWVFTNVDHAEYNVGSPYYYENFYDPPASFAHKPPGKADSRSMFISGIIYNDDGSVIEGPIILRN